MKFHEKLDFIMNITKTTNSALARILSLDASYVSRLRRGRRRLPSNVNYVESMALYFARHCDNHFQKQALNDMLNNGRELTDDPEKNAKLIEQWLLDQKTDENKTVKNFLNKLSNYQIKDDLFLQNNKNSSPYSILEAENAIYYGLEGKRRAVIAFFSFLLEEKETQTLLLFSDETMDWLTEDREFSAQWASYMSQLIMRGNKIIIIHTVSRNLDEMLSAINHWLPLYMTGAIQPYYYPKKRDGIFKRTLFIAPKTAAVISSSVGTMASQAANMLFTNQKAICAFGEEFTHYLNLCRPLMNIFTLKDKDSYSVNLFEFEKKQADSIIQTNSLFSLTMPEDIASSILSKLEYSPKSDLLDYHKKRVQNFISNLSSNHFTEIIKLPDGETVKNGKAKFVFAYMSPNYDIYYTEGEYIRHLENIVLLLQTYENFHVFLVENIKNTEYMVYVKEDFGSIITKTSAPPVILATNESNMTAAYWDFVTNIIGEKSNSTQTKKHTIAKLQSFIRNLK